jgi:hypothetical protein
VQRTPTSQVTLDSYYGQWWMIPGGTVEQHSNPATRYFFRDEALGKEIISYLPPELGITRVVSYMRFIRYPLGGYIAPHTDGIHVDEETGASSTTSFLL